MRKGTLGEVISDFGGIEGRKEKWMDGQCAVCSAPQGKEERDRVWPVGPVKASDGWNVECVFSGVGRDEAGKGGRSQLINGLITWPLDFILKSMGSHLRI